jgi:hypothetical protein
VHCKSRVAVAVARRQFRNPGRATYTIGRRYQRTGEGTEDQEDSAHAVVNCQV